jgi:hypothetical protein
MIIPIKCPKCSNEFKIKVTKIEKLELEKQTLEMEVRSLKAQIDLMKRNHGAGSSDFFDDIFKNTKR